MLLIPLNLYFHYWDLITKFWPGSMKWNPLKDNYTNTRKGNTIFPTIIKTIFFYEVINSVFHFEKNWSEFSDEVGWRIHSWYKLLNSLIAFCKRNSIFFVKINTLTLVLFQCVSFSYIEYKRDSEKIKWYYRANFISSLPASNFKNNHTLKYSIFCGSKGNGTFAILYYGLK